MRDAHSHGQHFPHALLLDALLREALPRSLLTVLHHGLDRGGRGLAYQGMAVTDTAS